MSHRHMLKSIPLQLDNPSAGEDVKPLNDGSRSFFHFSLFLVPKGRPPRKKHLVSWALPKLTLTLFILGAKTKVKKLSKLRAGEGLAEGGILTMPKRRGVLFLGDLPYCSIYIIDFFTFPSSCSIAACPMVRPALALATCCGGS